MRELIRTKSVLCEGCNRCVRECPMEMANITYLDEEGNIKVKIDTTKCITCGRCISACKHNARYYMDDTARFFDDLSNGVSISLIAAPAIRTNISDYKRLFTYLKSLGVNKIYDVSLGADICTWAHIRYIENNKPAPFITQPCPAIVTYCEIYQHNLLSRLSPVHSPMACTSIYMKEYEGIKDHIAALSPCVAKTNEFEDTGIAQYNVTFIKLREYMERNNIQLPTEETGFDHYESGVGSLFPMPGGLKENIEFFAGKKFHISKGEGFDIYERINIYSKTPENLLPEIYDVLNCHEGCNIGTACSHDKIIFEIDSSMDDSRKAATDNRNKEYFESLYETYDNSFDLSHFMREYQPIHTHFPKITEDDIQKAFDLLDKNNYVKQNVDCGACGSETCQNMARKIALEVNIPVNCLVKSRDDVREIASKDSLTNIFNRRHFMELSKVQIDRMLRTNGRGFFAMFDLDHFKVVNDTYGHVAGDKVLRDVAQRVKKVIRPYDIFGRYGGEEFILFMLDIDKISMDSAMERVRKAVCRTPIIFEDQEISISASFGVAPAAPINDMDTAIKYADEALYQAKKGGRNKVVFYDE